MSIVRRLISPPLSSYVSGSFLHGLDALHDIKVYVFFSTESEARLLHIPHRVPIEIWAKAPGEGRHEVKKDAERADLAAHVLEHQQLPVRLHPVL